jgi:hypothetical protein
VTDDENGFIHFQSLYHDASPLVLFFCTGGLCEDDWKLNRRSGISKVGILPVNRVALDTFSARLAPGDEAVLENKKNAVMHRKKRKRSVEGLRRAMIESFAS